MLEHTITILIVVISTITSFAPLAFIFLLRWQRLRRQRRAATIRPHQLELWELANNININNNYYYRQFNYIFRHERLFHLTSILIANRKAFWGIPLAVQLPGRQEVLTDRRIHSDPQSLLPSQLNQQSSQQLNQLNGSYRPRQVRLADGTSAPLATVVAQARASSETQDALPGPDILMMIEALYQGQRNSGSGPHIQIQRIQRQREREREERENMEMRTERLTQQIPSAESVYGKGVPYIIREEAMNDNNNLIIITTINNGQDENENNNISKKTDCGSHPLHEGRFSEKGVVYSVSHSTVEDLGNRKHTEEQDRSPYIECTFIGNNAWCVRSSPLHEDETSAFI
ncbi:hypothetical protein LSM04_008078 [Trypanosoma melophagium]|uniref:uncharacterized protein n=1 Tax=Trypanosoma melophagium TaxID=715481 RepID=UPI00351A2641|nr:hypothetical protein LSM04_008078 [Trypanosoma melophagium]